jgi:hypothetical protein
MKIEVQLKIGDSGSWKDGMVIVAKPLGVLWDPATVEAFIKDDTPPAGFSQLPAPRKAIIRRRMRQIAWLSDPERTVADLQVMRPQLSAEDAQARIDEAVAFRAEAETYGADTNYGTEERKAFGVIIADVTYARLETLFDDGTSLAVHPFAVRQTVGRRKFRVPYEALLSAGTVTDLQNRSKVVAVNRAATAVPFASLLEVIS